MVGEGERGAGTRRGREERPHLDPRRHPAGIFWFIDHSEGCCHPVRLVGSAVCIRTIHSCSSCTEGTRTRWKRNGKRHRGRRCQWHDLLREGGEMCCDRGRGCTGSDRVLLVGRRRGGGTKVGAKAGGGCGGENGCCTRWVAGQQQAILGGRSHCASVAGRPGGAGGCREGVGQRHFESGGLPWRWRQWAAVGGGGRKCHWRERPMRGAGMPDT